MVLRRFIPKNLALQVAEQVASVGDLRAYRRRRKGERGRWRDPVNLGL